MRLLKNATMIIILSLLLPTACKAQRVFSEGVLRYAVSMYKISDRSLIQKGSFTLYIKGEAIRKDLILEDGFHHMVVHTGRDEIYSLQETEGQKLAISLSRTQLDKEQKKFRGLVCSPQNETRVIASLKSIKGIVRYSNGIETEIWFSNEWKLANQHIFERFPEVSFLPVIYTYPMADGIEIRLELEYCKSTPVANSMFRIPSGYKIISSEEYKRLSE